MQREEFTALLKPVIDAVAGADWSRDLGDELGQWRMLKKAASDAIADNGGTISHHHGVGQDHAAWMPQEKGPLALDMIAAAKREVDPKGVLNPGKLLPR